MNRYWPSGFGRTAFDRKDLGGDDRPSEPKLNRQKLANELKEGTEIPGATLSNPEPVLSVRVR